MARGKKLSDAYVEVRADDSKLIPEVKVKAQRVGKEFGGQLNKSLKQLKIDTVDIKSSPKEALAAIRATQERLTELSRNAESVEVKIRTDTALRKLEQFQKRLGDVGNDSGDDAARGFAAQFGARVGPLMAKLPISGPLIASVGILGAALAPTLGAAVAGGIIGGAGATGVIGGLTLAAKDARVQASAKALGKSIEDRLMGSAGVFVQPTLDGLKQVEKALATVDVEEILRDSSRFVPVLVKGVTSAVEDMGDGFEALTGKADPVIASLSRTIASFGQQFGESFRLLSDDADEGASAIDDLTLAMTNMVQVSFAVIHGLASIKGHLDEMDDEWDTGRRAVEDFFTSMSGGRAEFDLTADGMGVVEARAKAQAEAEKKLGAQHGALAGQIKPVIDLEARRKEGQQQLSAVQQQLTLVQGNLNQQLAAMVPAGTAAAKVAESLRTASKNMFGARIDEMEATEAYEASLDSLSESVKSNKRSLDLHTVAGRANRDSLQALLGSSNEMYYANIAQGKSTDDARKLHEKRTEAVRKESIRLGLNKTETDKLINTYGRIPPKKSTDLLVEGVTQIVTQLKRLYIAQRALAEGKTINEVRHEGTSAMRSLLYTGGYTGDGGKYEPKGTVHGGEFVIRKESTQKIRRTTPGLLEEMNATGQVQGRGYAAGGIVAPVDASRRMRFEVDASRTYVMSMARARSLVTPAFTSGDWPSSAGSQRGDSGVWRKVVALIKSTGPFSGSFGNGYRPGDPKWHGSGRAVDWMGFNQDRLASFLAAKRPLELIHRTRSRDYAYTRGVNKGSFNEPLMNAHKNHVHIAMDDEGVRVLKPGMNMIPNNTGRPEPIAGPKAIAALSGDTYNLHFHGVVSSKQAAQDMVLGAIKQLKYERKI